MKSSLCLTWSSLIVLLKNKGYVLKILLRGLEVHSLKKKFYFEFQHLEFSERFCIDYCK